MKGCGRDGDDKKKGDVVDCKQSTRERSISHSKKPRMPPSIISVAGNGTEDNGVNKEIEIR